jgi:uncharacterized RmlC-like cupin family protein
MVFVILLCAAFGATTARMQEMRLTPEEIAKIPFDSRQTGSSNLAGVKTKILQGDPSKSDFYTILLFVPAHTTIAAHSHRDDRMAVVVSGSWNFGYGTRFEEKALKKLPPGSVYSEPGHLNHFARTDDLPTVVEISGYGPTDTIYFDRVNDPALKK